MINIGSVDGEQTAQFPQLQQYGRSLDVVNPPRRTNEVEPIKEAAQTLDVSLGISRYYTNDTGKRMHTDKEVMGRVKDFKA